MTEDALKLSLIITPPLNVEFCRELYISYKLSVITLRNRNSLVNQVYTSGDDKEPTAGTFSPAVWDNTIEFWKPFKFKLTPKLVSFNRVSLPTVKDEQPKA